MDKYFEKKMDKFFFLFFFYFFYYYFFYFHFYFFPSKHTQQQMNRLNNKIIGKGRERVSKINTKAKTSNKVCSDIDVDEYANKLSRGTNTFVNFMLVESMCGANGNITVPHGPHLISTSQIPLTMLKILVNNWKVNNSRVGKTIENPMVAYDFSVNRNSDMTKSEEYAAKFYWWFMENFEDFNDKLCDDEVEPIKYSFDSDDIIQKVVGNGFVEYITHPSMSNAIPFGTASPTL
jgi:hypothetical protein